MNQNTASHNIHQSAARHMANKEYMAQKYLHTTVDTYFSLFPHKPTKAITVKQPLATLVASGVVDVVNSPHKTNYRGLVFIHAAKQLCENLKFTDRQRKNPIVDILLQYKDWATGALIGCVEIVDCVRNHPSKWAEKGKWNYVLRNPIFFKYAVTKVSGRSMVWDYKGDVQPSGEGYVLKSIAAKLPDAIERKKQQREENFKSAVSKSTNVMMHELSAVQQIQVGFTPLVIAELIWNSAIEVTKIAAAQKIDFLKKFTRKIKSLHDDYNSEVRKHLDADKIKRYVCASQNVAQCMAINFYHLRMAVEQEFIRVSPDYPYRDARIAAMSAVMTIRMLDRFYSFVNAEIIRPIQSKDIAPSIMPPELVELEKICRAIAGVASDFNENDRHIVTAVKVLVNKFRESDFDIY